MPISIRAYLNGEGFDDQQIAAMNSAYQEATGVCRSDQAHPLSCTK